MLLSTHTHTLRKVVPIELNRNLIDSITLFQLCDL